MNSEKINALLKNFKVTIPVGVVLGLILGLIIGWGIWPVQWTDLAPYHLRADLREDYLRMSIYTYSSSGDASIATKAWSELEDTAEETLEAVRNNPVFLSNDQITSFELVVGAGVNEDESTVEETLVPEDADDERSPNWLLLGGFCIVLLVVASGVVYFLLVRNRHSQENQPETLESQGHTSERISFDQNRIGSIPQAQESYKTPFPDEPAVPAAQFMTTYMLGDDLYDDSFSIDAPTGEFLGECGVGISETVGVGEPKRVTAFEVWLFDKNDIQTVTKVVMSAHAYENDKIHMRLESKGEPILAETGKQVLLETATLQLEARIVDMEYGEGAAPDQSFFQRLTLELAVWPK
jgi:hypothetical protein